MNLCSCSSRIPKPAFEHEADVIIETLRGVGGRGVGGRNTYNKDFPVMLLCPPCQDCSGLVYARNIEKLRSITLDLKGLEFRVLGFRVVLL